MKLGIIGLPQTGKKVLFELLTGTSLSKETNESQKSISGIAIMKDLRFDKLVEIYKPKKEAPARIDIKLLPKIELNSDKNSDFFRELSDIDALCHIVRTFKNESVYHVSGSIDVVRDINSINSELLLNDLIFVERRLEKIDKDRKRKDEKRFKDEQELMNKFKAHLESELPLRMLPLEKDEESLISGYPLLTLKKIMILLNVDDSDLSDTSLLTELSEKFKNQDIDFIFISALLEKEIASLDSLEDRAEFMKDAGITESALNIISAHSMKLLGLISFFTVGKDEVKQWLIRKNSSAPEAAGAVHSDIQRGFIRAEVTKYKDLIELGNEEAVKKAGKFYVMGKDYIVEDGDIINFRFNI
jgi:hypothetical protein